MGTLWKNSEVLSAEGGSRTHPSSLRKSSGDGLSPLQTSRGLWKRITHYPNKQFSTHPPLPPLQCVLSHRWLGGDSRRQFTDRLVWRSMWAQMGLKATSSSISWNHRGRNSCVKTSQSTTVYDVKCLLYTKTTKTSTSVSWFYFSLPSILEAVAE